MFSSPYYDTLLDCLPDAGQVKKIVRGVSWTAALLENGQAGVAMHTEGESRPRMLDTLEGLPVRRAAEAALSWNLEEASEGMAVINACFNTEARADALGCFYTANALEGIDVAGKTVGFVGHLISHSGITEQLLAPAKEFFIMEREPKPGDYPDSACEYLLPRCDLVVITGSASVNKTMPRLLELSHNAEIVLTGPTVTLCPELFSHGVSRLNCQFITDAPGMLDLIVQKRTSVNAFSRHCTLDI